MSYYITTDATCDLPKTYHTDDFHIIPMSYLINDVEYGIDKMLESDVFYNMIREGAMPSTSLITTYFTKENLKPILDSGNDIMHICFSSGLSSTYDNVMVAIMELRAEYPDRKILLLDSKGASTGEGLLVLLALKARENGMDLQANYDYTLANRDQICHYFTADDLHHLQRGGRISKAAAFAGTILKIKPLMYCNANGKLIPLDKAKGRKKALIWLVEQMIEKILSDRNDQMIFVSHADCIEDAEFVKAKILEKTEYTDVQIGEIGPVIGTHSGPGTVALFFIGENKISAKDESLNS